MEEVTFFPHGKSGRFKKGTRLIDAASRLSIGIESSCGNTGLCGKCKVRIEEGNNFLSSLTNSEKDLFSSQEIKKGYRLSCQAKIQNAPIRVVIPDVARREGQVVLAEGKEVAFEKNPAVQKYHIRIPKPSLKDQVADFERIKEYLKEQHGVHIKRLDYTLMKELPGRMRAEADSEKSVIDVTSTVWRDEELTQVEPGYEEDRYGLAIDVGTTTVVCYLVDLRTGEDLAVGSALNPQASFGEDVMTRVSKATDPERRGKLKESIISGINRIIEDVARDANIEKDKIYEAVMVGNTAMHHLFLGIDPKYLASAPYVPGVRSGVNIKAREIGVDINPLGYIHWLPVNAGWVGADNVGMLLVTQVHDKFENVLAIDVGTNGEVVVSGRNKTLVTSTAAGPAFEGAQIRDGMRAAPGAIEKVRIDSESLEPDYKTIGDSLPLGICGSGITDAVAEMLRTGIIDRSGRFEQKKKDCARIREDPNGTLEYVLVWEKESGIETDIAVTQGDVREVQKAKGAIQAGCRVLMNELGIKNFDQVLLAGAFGNYVDKESAMIIGLFPEVDLEKVESIGNAAGEGAKLALMSVHKRGEAERIPTVAKFFELGGTKEFRDNYMESLYFPHKDLDLYPRVKEKIMEVA